MFVRMVTLVFGLLMTRVLSGHFSLQDYGTYSQIMLLVTTISSMTILGMMDGINYFFCREQDEQKRNAYVSTIFFLQYLVCSVVSLTILLCTVPISNYFDNPDLKPLILFAATLPILQNSISLLQIMFIAIGKAKVIAIRNLLVSVAKLGAIMLACYVFDNVAVLLLCQLLMDVAQVVYFFVTLKRRQYPIHVFRFDKSLIKEILVYCIPMAMFAVIKSLNRDSDKFVISFFTDTETLAVYTNASKLLPFDLVMTSFCTVLLPYITRYISRKAYAATQSLYKSFLELSYISTTILAVGAICVAPDLMRFLYTEKYTAYGYGQIVFILYILVDIFSVLNITLILSAAGKTKTILLASVGTFVANIALNIGLFLLVGNCGPAIATLMVTIAQGLILLSISAKEIQTNLFRMFNGRYLVWFIVQIAVGFVLCAALRQWMVLQKVPYIMTLIVVFGVFAGMLLLCNGRRLRRLLQTINSCKMEPAQVPESD